MHLSQRKQEAGELVQEYLTTLQQIAANCWLEPNEYGSHLRDVLFQAFDMTICSRSSMRRRIC